MYGLEAFDRNMICWQHIATFLVIAPLQYNSNKQPPCAACKSSPIETIFYDHTSSTNSNIPSTQTDR